MSGRVSENCHCQQSCLFAHIEKKMSPTSCISRKKAKFQTSFHQQLNINLMLHDFQNKVTLRDLVTWSDSWHKLQQFSSRHNCACKTIPSRAQSLIKHPVDIHHKLVLTQSGNTFIYQMLDNPTDLNFLQRLNF